MRTASKGFAIGVAALAVVSTACDDATRPTSAEPALYEGALVSLKGTMQMSAVIDGKRVNTITHEWAVDGVVRDGIALASRDPGKLLENPSLPTLAISDDPTSATLRAPNRRDFASLRDKLGNQHDFVFMNGSQGGPVRSVVHLQNGKLGQIFSFDWRKVRGGWIAQGFAVTVFKDGRPIGTMNSGTKLSRAHGPSNMLTDDQCYFDAEYAALSGNCDGSPTFGGGAAQAGAVVVEQPATALTRSQQRPLLWSPAGFATGDMLTALTAWTVWAETGVWSAWVYVGYLVYRYVECYYECQASIPSGGGGGSGFLRASPVQNPSSAIRKGSS